MNDRPPPYPGMPRWVKVSGIAAAVLAVLLVGLALMDGDHGPGRHMHQTEVRP